MQPDSELAESVGLIEGSVTVVEQIGWRVIDVEQDRVEGAVGGVRIEAGLGCCSEGELEEIAVHELAAGIGSELRTKRDEASEVPFDDGREVVDDKE